MTTISRLYNNYSDAQAAVSALEAAGVKHSDISIIASNADNRFSTDPKENRIVDRDLDGRERASGAGTGAGLGAAVGGGLGLLTGLGIMAIPGVGPIVAAGWLAATLTGAAAGAASGGILGALTEGGVSKDDAGVYAEGVRRGGAVVSARVPDADATRLQAMMDRSAVRTADRAAAYRKTGWKSYDPTAPAYTAEQVSRERDLYR